MYFAYSTAMDLSERVGCRLLTVDAYPTAIPFYEKLGFVRNQHKDYADKAEKNHPSMRYDIHKEPNWLSDDDPAGSTGG